MGAAVPGGPQHVQRAGGRRRIYAEPRCGEAEDGAPHDGCRQSAEYQEEQADADGFRSERKVGAENGQRHGGGHPLQGDEKADEEQPQG